MRLYRALLKLYPERFRHEYRDEMCRAFAERTRGRSRVAIIALSIADVVPNAIAAHWDILRHGAAAGTAVPAFAGDVRFAIRQIVRTPLLSGVIIGVIALGIGINAGLLTVLNTYAWHRRGNSSGSRSSTQADGRARRRASCGARCYRIRTF